MRINPVKGVSKVEYPFKGVTLRADDMDLTAYFFQVTLNATYRRRLITMDLLRQLAATTV